MSYGLNLDWGRPILDYIGFSGRPIEGYATNLVRGSCEHHLHVACIGDLISAGESCTNKRKFLETGGTHWACGTSGESRDLTAD